MAHKLYSLSPCRIYCYCLFPHLFIHFINMFFFSPLCFVSIHLESFTHIHTRSFGLRYRLLRSCEPCFCFCVDFLSATSNVIFCFRFSVLTLFYAIVAANMICKCNYIILIGKCVDAFHMKIHPFSHLVSIVMLFFYQVIKDVPIYFIFFLSLLLLYFVPWLPHSL